MTMVDEQAPRPQTAVDTDTRPAPLVVAGFASLGAGAIHAAAIGVHSEHRQAVLAFTLVAAFQLGWGVLALVRPSRLLAAVGVLGHAVALGGWLLAKTSGLSFVDGMEEAEAVQTADGLAAGLAAVTVLAAIATLLPARQPGLLSRRPTSALFSASALAAAVIAVPGMAVAGGHAHAGGNGTTADHHSESASVALSDDHGGHGSATAAGAEPEHGPAAVVAPVPYDPTMPIDLGGVEGVTPQQQARAENLIAITLDRLPQFADPAAAEAAGYHSIGDAATGYEHFINWSLINDDTILNPDEPESLVYANENGQRVLEAAMFMLPTSATLDSVPEIGGSLTQWHIHDDLCFSDDPTAPRVAGITTVGGACQAPLVKFDPVPMIHVWITKHPCGPFSALEGIGAGQIQAGETRLCDTAHGAH